MEAAEEEEAAAPVAKQRSKKLAQQNAEAMAAMRDVAMVEEMTAADCVPLPKTLLDAARVVFAGGKRRHRHDP